MARVSIPGSVRGPLAPGMEKTLTANPFQLAASALKNPFPPPKVARGKAPSPPKRSSKNPFYGE
jgi:hypothetical protein